MARNGQKFLLGLTEKESKNPQFDFLKPTHGLFSYFTQLVDSYSKVIVPRNENMHRLNTFSHDKLEVLRCGMERYMWERRREEEN